MTQTAYGKYVVVRVDEDGQPEPLAVFETLAEANQCRNDMHDQSGLGRYDDPFAVVRYYE